VRSLPVACPELVAAIAAADQYPPSDEGRHTDDVRRLVDKHLPAEYRSKFAWRKLAALLRRAAQGKDEAAEVSTALQIILRIERVPFQV
jgi:hypothetical protein